jgi:hypothetical protein
MYQLFIVGTVGMIGSDDVLACFIAGNVFTWDDWFRLETKDDSLQPTIDMLLNVGVFMWFGAVCPWHLFAENNVIPIYRLIPLGILVLLLRRLPMILVFQKGIHQVEDVRRALFLGYFGPIGVSAIFYLYISKEFLREIVYQGAERADAAHLSEMMDVVVWFLVLCSIVGHGLSIPLGKLGLYLPRTISTALSSDRLSFAQSTARDNSESEPDQDGARDLASVFRRRRPVDGDATPTPSALSRPPTGPPIDLAHNLVKPADSGGIFASPSGLAASSTSQKHSNSRPVISAPSNPRAIGRAVGNVANSAHAQDSAERLHRSIRFGDEGGSSA